MFCKKCGAHIADDSSFCYKCGERTNSNTEIVKISNLNTDKLNTAEMATYLKMVCSLENDKFTLESSKADLNYKARTYGIKRKFPKPYKAESGFDFSDYSILILVGALLGLIGSSIYIFLTASGSTIEKILFILFFSWLHTEIYAGIVIGIVSALFLILCFAIKESQATSRENKQRLREYKTKVADDNVRVEREKKCIPIFYAHIKEIDKKIAVLNSTLNKLYSYDLIFKKYRGNIVALNTMYEYFISGRVTSLAAQNGMDGAYNLYENELRQNIIIEKLDVIINSLEQIKANQYLLYEAIQEANQALLDITDMAEKVSNIESNTALTAYNSKVIADNTKVLSYIETIQFLKS